MAEYRQVSTDTHTHSCSTTAMCSSPVASGSPRSVLVARVLVSVLQQSSPVPALHLPSPSPPTPHGGAAGEFGSDVGTGPSSSLAATASSGLLEQFLDANGGAYGSGSMAATLGAASTSVPSHTHAHTGVFSAHRSQTAIAASLKAASAARHIDALAAGAQQMAAQAELLRAQFAQEQKVAQAMSAEISSLEAEQSAALALPNMLERRTRSFALGQSIAAARTRAAAQDDVVARARRAFEAADLARDSFEAKKAELAELAELLRQRKEAENQELALLAQASQAHNAKLRARAARTAARTAEQQRREAEEDAALALSNHLRAEEARARHAEEMRHVNAQIGERQAAMDALLAEALRARTEAITSLKANTAAAHHELMAANLKRKKALARREEARAHERKELEGAGRNADAIFAARDEQARQAVHTKKLEVVKADRAERLRVQMAAEAAKAAKAETAAAKDAAVLAQYKRNMGHSVIDTTAAAMERSRQRKEEKRRNDDALQVALLESKRFVPDDASEAEDEEDGQAGGMQLQQRQHGVSIANFLAIQHAATDAAAAATAAPAAAAAGDSSDEDDFGGAGGAAPGESLLSPADALAAWKRDNPLPGAEYNEWGLRLIPNHSSAHRAALDARKIARALSAAKAALARGKDLVVCGKEYAHTSKFLAEPSRGFVFDDFVVGREERREVTLTNVSFSFNHFKVLALDERYADFFSVEFVPVGRMVAGATARIAVIFRPKVNADIATVVPFLAETGPFSVPLVARTRKADIHVAPWPVLDMGCCVLGDAVEHSFTVTNRGAIPVDFVVEHVAKQRREEDGGEGETKNQDALRGGEEEKEQTGGSPSVGTASDLKPLNLSGLVSPAIEAEQQAAAAAAAAAGGASGSPPGTACGSDGGVLVEAMPHPISNPPNWHTSATDARQLAEAQRRELDHSTDYLHYEQSGRVEGYSSTKWTLRFAPRVVGDWSHSFVLRFGPQHAHAHAAPMHWGSERDFAVEVRGRGTDVPVYVETPLIDFQAALYGKTYRTALVLHNRDTTAHKVSMRFPRALRAAAQAAGEGVSPADWVEFTPAVGYIQKKSSLAVQIKLSPSAAMWAALRQCSLEHCVPAGAIGLRQYDEGHVFLPLRIDVADQTLPVHFGLTARLVEPALSLQPSALNFGAVFTSETKALVLRLENRSPLLQHVIFPRLRPEVSVEPDGGMLTLPPFRSAEVNVCFTPNSAIDYEFSVALCTKLGQRVEIPLRARGLKPPLVVQHTQIAFAATPNFTSVHAATLVRNQSAQHRQTVHLLLDEPDEELGVRESIHSQRSFLSFFPAVFELGPAVASDKTGAGAGAGLSPTAGPSSPSSISGKSRSSAAVDAAAAASVARVEVQFRPWLNLDELYAHVNTEGFDSRQQSEGEEDGEEGAREDGRSHRRAHSNSHDDDDGHRSHAAHALEDEKTATGSPRLGLRSKKPEGSPSAGGGAKSKKKKLTAEQEAELARLRAAEEELRRLEAEKAAAVAAAAAEAAARAASLAEEFNSRAALESRERVQPSNDLPRPSVVEFSDRLQLAVEEQQQRVQAASSRIDQLERERRLDDGYDDDEDEDAAEQKYGDDEDDQLSVVASMRAANSASKAASAAEPYSRHARHRVAVHIRSTHIASGEVTYSCMWLQVSTTMLLPQLEVRPHFVQFGQVALGEARTMSFEVRNTASVPPPSAGAQAVAQASVQLCMDTLGFSSHFSVLNALRPLGPGEIQIVVVEFRPRREGKSFKQDLVLRDQRNRNVQVHVPLLGLCISPDLEIVLPAATTAAAAGSGAAAAESGKGSVAVAPAVVPSQSTLADGSIVPLLHLGDCMSHESLSRSFEVRNRSAHAYHYRLVQQPVADADAHASHVHGSGLAVTASTANIGPGAGAPDAFYFVPSRGVIAPGGVAHISVVFTPRSTTEFFPYQTLVRVGNQQLHVQAEVHERQLFVAGGRQVRTPASVAEPVSAAVALAVQGASFQLKSLVSGVTQLAPNLVYQNPLAFLDGAAVTQASVGGGAVAAAFPLLMSDSGAAVWERVPALADDASNMSSAVRADAAAAAAGDKGKKKAGQGKDGKKASGDGSSGGGRESSARGSKSGGAGGAAAAGPGSIGATEGFDPAAAAHRLVELTFDANRIVDLSQMMMAASGSGGGSKGRGRDRGAAAADPSAQALYLVETVQVGSCVLGGAGAAVEPVSSGGKGEKDAGGSYDVTLHSVRDPAAAPTAAASSSSSSGEKPSKSSSGGGSHGHSGAGASSSSSSSGGPASSLDPDSVLSLFAVEPSGGALRPGAKDTVHFLFDWNKYQALKAAGAHSHCTHGAGGRACVSASLRCDAPGSSTSGLQNLTFASSPAPFVSSCPSCFPSLSDGERRVLSVGQWLEAAARITLKGGAAPAHLPSTQVIDVRLRVYVD